MGQSLHFPSSCKITMVAACVQLGLVAAMPQTGSVHPLEGCLALQHSKLNERRSFPAAATAQATGSKQQLGASQSRSLNPHALPFEMPAAHSMNPYARQSETNGDRKLNPNAPAFQIHGAGTIPSHIRMPSGLATCPQLPARCRPVPQPLTVAHFEAALHAKAAWPSTPPPMWTPTSTADASSPNGIQTSLSRSSSSQPSVSGSNSLRCLPSEVTPPPPSWSPTVPTERAAEQPISRQTFLLARTALRKSGKASSEVAKLWSTVKLPSVDMSSNWQ